MRKPSVAAINRLEVRFDRLTGTDGPARISGLVVRPPVVSESEYALSTARGEPDFIKRGGLVIKRPVTAEIAEGELLLGGDDNAISTPWVK